LGHATDAPPIITYVVFALLMLASYTPASRPATRPQPPICRLHERLPRLLRCATVSGANRRREVRLPGWSTPAVRTRDVLAKPTVGFLGQIWTIWASSLIQLCPVVPRFELRTGLTWSRLEPCSTFPKLRSRVRAPFPALSQVSQSESCRRGCVFLTQSGSAN
jgi:hypothetical protein